MICRKAMFTLSVSAITLPDATCPSARAQNRHFCALFAFGTSISGFSSTKSGFLCAFDLQNPHFQAFRAQNRHFCVRMGDFSEIFGRFDTKMGFLCSGREVIGIGKRNRFLPANHRAGFQNANTS